MASQNTPATTNNNPTPRETLPEFEDRCFARTGWNREDIRISSDPEDLLTGQILCKRGGEYVLFTGQDAPEGETLFYKEDLLRVILPPKED